VNNYIWCVCGFEFNHPNRPFAIFFFIQSLSCFAALNVESFVKTQNEFLIYYGVTGLFGILAWITMLTFDFKMDRPKKLEEMTKALVKATDE